MERRRGHLVTLTLRCACGPQGLGRAVALQKPVADFLRRLVARTLARQFSSAFDEACRPHQFAFSTEALAHFLQVSTDIDPNYGHDFFCG